MPNQMLNNAQVPNLVGRVNEITVGNFVNITSILVEVAESTGTQDITTLLATVQSSDSEKQKDGVIAIVKTFPKLILILDQMVELERADSTESVRLQDLNLDDFIVVVTQLVEANANFLERVSQLVAQAQKTQAAQDSTETT